MDLDALISLELDVPELLVGVVVAEGLALAHDPAVVDRLVEAALAPGAERGGEAVRAAVRDLLRLGGFKPTGRNKPASEYLAGAAERGAFPRINGVVDINNALSLRTGWPMSVLDLDLMLGGAALAPGVFVVRWGRPGEAYVFNASGQELDLEGLLLVGRSGAGALGNPVKDAMAAKTSDGTRRIAAFIYGTRRATSVEAFETCVASYANHVREGLGASSVFSTVLGR